MTLAFLPYMIVSVYLFISLTLLNVEMTYADASTDIAINNITTSDIVGGTISAKGFYPFYAVTSDSGVCGASLIHPDILLTAAHCADVFENSVVSIGGNRLDGSDALENIRATEERPDPRYNNQDDDDFRYDFMLVKLA